MDIIITVNRLHVKKYFFLAVKILIIIWIRYLKLKYFSLIIGYSVGESSSVETVVYYHGDTSLFNLSILTKINNIRGSLHQFQILRRLMRLRPNQINHCRRHCNLVQYEFRLQ